MKPIPQTLEVARELEHYLGEGDMLARLESIAEEVRRVVPDCIGLSLAWNKHGITLTLVATDEEIARLDAVQYLDGGPCVTALEQGSGIETTADELVSEDPWRLFALATAAHGVRSTLTLPITHRGQVVGTVNLYGGTDRAFEGHHEELARILGAWAPGAVRNSDLSFSTRRLAENAPEQLRDDNTVNKAAGMLAALHDVDVSRAQRSLEDAAARAGVTPAQLAVALIDLREN
jgi:GAF domain-containing protein